MSVGPIILKGGYMAVPSYLIPTDKQHLVETVKWRDGYEFGFVKQVNYWIKDDFEYVYETEMKPFAHQKDTTKFLCEHNKCFLFSSMGTGKTISALWAIDHLFKTQQLKKRVLIVSPLSTLKSVWGKEIYTNFYYYKFNVIRGSKQKRADLLAEPAHFNIVNHDGLTAMLRSEEINPNQYDLIIYDEATALKTPSSARFQMFRKFCSSIPRIWLLTGTPIAQSPLDAFSLKKIVDPSWKMSYSGFRDMVMYKQTMFKWAPKDGATDVCYRMLQPAIRYSLDDCVDLPQHTIIPYEIPLTKQQTKVFDALKKDLVSKLDDGRQVVAVNAAVLLGKLLQCSAGVLYDNEGGQEILDFSERFNALIDIAESASTPVIVFVPFRGIQAVLMEKLSHHFGKGMVRVINGDTSLNERTEIVDLFQESKIKILLAHPKTTGHGIDLTASNVMVWYLPTFSNELYLQALDRIRRLSSVKRKHDKFLIYQFYSTNIEHNVYKALAAKGLTQSKVLELIRSK